MCSSACVARVAERAEHLALGARRVGEQRAAPGRGGWRSRRASKRRAAAVAVADLTPPAAGARERDRRAGADRGELLRRPARRTSRDPPTTVRQCGDPVTDSMPWWPGTRTGSAPGSGSAVARRARPHGGDQRHHEVVDEVAGVAVRRRRNSPRVGRPGRRSSSSRRAARWKRGTSRASAGSAAAASWRAAGEQAAQAACAGVLQPAASQRTDMLISDSWVRTPSSANSRSRCG